MTEYDFSEEGYRRHLETQHRVSNWAHQTSRHVPANPFVPSETDPEERSDFYSHTTDSKSKHSLSSSGTERPKLRRSHTSPHRDTSRRHDHSAKSNTHSRPSVTSTGTATPPRQRPPRSHTTDSYNVSTLPSRSQPVRSRSTPLDFENNFEKDVEPALKRGYTYIVIPRHGAPIKVVSPGPRPRNEHPPSPTKKSQPPLLKRIFGSIISGSTNSDNRSIKSGSSRRTGVETGGKPRRSRKVSY